MDGGDNAFITGVDGGYNPGDTYAESENNVNQDVDSDEEERSYQIFNVLEAVPPTDYEAPYS